MTMHLTPFRLLLIAAMAVAIVIGFIVVPVGASLPVHWNIAGEADGFLPREWALLMPALILVAVWVLFAVVMRFMPPAQREAGAHMAGVTFTAIMLLFLAITSATVAIGVGLPVSMVQVVAAGVAVLLLVLGNAMPKSRPNGFAGIRIPTTLRDPVNWQATHRLAGWLTMGGGLILLAAAFLMPTTQIVWWVIVCVLAPLLIGSVYSLILARRAA